MRPKTLAEVADQSISGEKFHHCLSNFLDEFYAHPDARALAEPPPSLASAFGEEGRIWDAYLAATAEELGRANQFPIPSWVFDGARLLHRPWFASSLAALRAVLILESPPAFRERNLFVSENALSRA